MKHLIFLAVFLLVNFSYTNVETSNSIDPFLFLKKYKDSSELMLRNGICPNFLFDPCLDYKSEFRKYHTCVWNLKTRKQEFCLCTDRVYCSFKKDLIDSINLDYLKFIYSNVDTSKLNKKCHDSLHLNSEPKICQEFSTLDLIKKRLINDTL
jgi:hypothetical protein